MKASKEWIELSKGSSFRVLRWNENLHDVESVEPDGRVVSVQGEGERWHYHSEMELTLFIDGQGTRFVGDHIGAFSAGDLVLLGEGLPHYWHTEGKCSGISLQWAFPREHPIWFFPESRELESLFRRAGNGIRLCGASRDVVAEAMDDIIREQGVARLGLMLRLLGTLVKLPEEDGNKISMDPFSLSSGSSWQGQMGDAMRYLITHFREEVKLEDVLRLTSMSKPTFSRQFRNHTGRTFSEFLLKLRLEAVCRDLVETNKTVLEIAYSCGFGQVSFFNRSFRRAFGCSPRQYRAGQFDR